MLLKYEYSIERQRQQKLFAESRTSVFFFSSFSSSHDSVLVMSTAPLVNLNFVHIWTHFEDYLKKFILRKLIFFVTVDQCC